MTDTPARVALVNGRAAPMPGVLVPLTLEILGRFNPVKPHRHRRTLRRHLPLMELLFHAAASHAAWLPITSGT